MYASKLRQSPDRYDLDFALSLNHDLGGQKFKTAITQLFLKLESPKFCMQVDLDNPQIDMTSILASASTSTSEVKNLKQP